MSPGPDFRDLVGDDLSPEEGARLRRVHDLLVAAGPPPELSPTLVESPAPPTAGVTSLLGRRRRVALLLAATLAVAAFGGGYLAGSRGTNRGSQAAFATSQVVRLSGGGAFRDATLVVRIGKRDANGNMQMLVTAEGLRHLPNHRYYTLWMTKRGKRLVECGSFNVAGGNNQTNVRLVVGYGLQGFDGFALTEYFHRGHRSVPRLAGRLI